MAKFNTKSTGTKTENLAGGEAFQETPKTEFVSLLLTSFVQDQYYRSEKDGLKQVQELLNSVDPLFAAKTAVFARNEFGMRSITHVAAAEIAHRVKGQKWTKDFYNTVVHRVDDITEILSYYLNVYGKPIPNSLKKGLGKAFEKFDTYQIAKYRSEKQKVSLVDAVNLFHPKHNETLQKLIKGELKSIDTWEAKLTETGLAENKEEAKNQAWTDLIKEKKLGYFALLRNLRNIKEQAPGVLDAALETLVNEKMIKKSLVLPFRFATAMQEMKKIDGANKILRALSIALDISCQNVPKFDGNTLVVLDTSGSMEGRPAQIGSLFSAILVKANDADFMSFSEDAEYQSMNPLDSTLTLAEGINFAMGGTNFHSIFKTANKKYDRIIILSDMQGWMHYDAPTGTFAAYKAKYNADPFIYSFDLTGYGTLQFPERKVFAIAGFSDKIFDIMKILEQDKNALVKRIEAVEIQKTTKSNS